MDAQTKDWLRRVKAACHAIQARIECDDYAESFYTLRRAFKEDVPIGDVTWEVKDLIASIATSHPPTIAESKILRRAARRRLKEVVDLIDDELLHATSTTEGSTHASDQGDEHTTSDRQRV